MDDNQSQYTAWFIAAFRYGMLTKYQLTNRQVAEAINGYEQELGITGCKPVSGIELRHWGNKAYLDKHPIQPDRLNRIFQLYNRHTLIPVSQPGWHGLIFVHQILTRESPEQLPHRFHQAGLSQWLRNFANPAETNQEVA